MAKCTVYQTISNKIKLLREEVGSSKEDYSLNRAAFRNSRRGWIDEERVTVFSRWEEVAFYDAEIDAHFSSLPAPNPVGKHF